MGTKRPQCRRDWDKELKEIGQRVGFEVVAWDGYPAKRNKVLIRCPHGEKWVFPQGQLNKETCCRSSSKTGERNPFYNKPTWNAGTQGISSGHGFGYKPRGELASKDATLYLVEYVDDFGSHIKIGITGKTIRSRLKAKLRRVIGSWEMPFEECFKIEQAVLKYVDLLGHRYCTPTTTELIKAEALDSVLSFIEHSMPFS